MIEMKDVYKTYSNGVLAINGISIKINQGEFVYIVGPSGAGKSTFIKLMYREEKPTKGSIVINGIQLENLKKKKCRICGEISGLSFKILNYCRN